MKNRDSTLNITLTTANLLLWVWVFFHMKQHGDHLAPPLLTALIAMLLAALIQYRSVLQSRKDGINAAS